MKNQKPPVVSKKVLLPFILITSLFALWGFANDITNPMVSAFKKILELSNTQASWVQAAFYGGYFTMALPAAYVAKKYSYKTGILVGLTLYAMGALLFYPAAAMENYFFFLMALYILTFGLAFLGDHLESLYLGYGCRGDGHPTFELGPGVQSHWGIVRLVRSTDLYFGPLCNQMIWMPKETLSTKHLQARPRRL